MSLIVIPGHIFIGTVGSDHVSGIEVTALAMDNRARDTSVEATRESLLAAFSQGASELRSALHSRAATVFNIGKTRDTGIRALRR